MMNYTYCGIMVWPAWGAALLVNYGAYTRALVSYDRKRPVRIVEVE